jgi:leucyl/phenylalanyl-tRNA--protein transferase
MSDIHILSNESMEFPPVAGAMVEPNGLLAVGGDLCAERLLAAYRAGIFPWYSEGDPILWWSPDPRAVLFPKEIKISRSLKKKMNKNLFRITFDTAFESVINLCASPRAAEGGTWINNEMIQSYTRLHKMGYAHSVECWQDDDLVGGLYGVCLGQLFCGESMFSLVSDASKIAFVALVRQLDNWGFPLIDCQVPNEHLSSLGAREISRKDFIACLNRYATLPGRGPAVWVPD